MQTWHVKTIEQTFEELKSSNEGLAQTQADSLIETYGLNELEDKGSKKPIKILFEQVTAVMVLILIAASLLSLALGKLLEASAIGIIVVLFVLLGFYQEYKAEKAIAALKKMSVPFVQVMRNNRRQEINAHHLVPGDVVFLEAGSIVPADMRIIESANLKIEEASLTGESEAVEKTSDTLDDPELTIGDRRNIAYSSTQVTFGRGTGVVINTGMNSEIGRIATLLQSFAPGVTPLQQKLDSVGKQLALLGVFVAMIVVGLGAISGETFGDLVLTAISVAVAVIPEGLPAVVTFTLAIGSQRMLKRNALIRKLPAVETLGSVTYICSDKTGTLTQNKMTATIIDTFDEHLDIQSDETKLSNNAKLSLLIGALCNDGTLHISETSEVSVLGDPTETSLLVAANKFGMDIDRLNSQFVRVLENPFDASRKRMSTVHEIKSDNELSHLVGLNKSARVSFVKGAKDGILDHTKSVLCNGEIKELTSEFKTRIEAANESMASEGMRVLGLAYREIDENSDETHAEEDLIFVGLVGIIDPPRKEVKHSVELCKTAGIVPVMITGDHPLTALAIAHELGITEENNYMVGADIEHLSDEELEEKVLDISVFARVSPEHKLRIVQALQKHKNIVAMTGDGVNDAPALKKADIGVAMGITGTDVSKEASDMVLRDDNFSTIVAAVEEGRVIYDNLKRFVKFAVAGNIGKILVMVLWPIPFLISGDSAGTAIALLPLQLLWLNLMTDGLLGLSMGIEPAEEGVMKRNPHNPTDSIWANGLGKSALWIGFYIGVVSLAVGFIYYYLDLEQWQTMMFMSLAFLQVFQAIGSRSETQTLLSKGLFTNPTMTWIVSLVVALQLVAIYTPLSDFLKLDSLSVTDVLISFGVGFSLIVLLEIEKIIRGKKQVNN